MQYLLQKNITRLFASVSVLIFLSQAAFAQSFGAGNLAVLRIGNGSGTLSSDATPISIIEFTPSGAVTGFSVSLPSTGTTKITNSGSASSEGFMELSAEHDQLILAGYDAASGTSGVVGTSSSSVNRELFSVISNGAYTKVASSSAAHSANNIRSGTASATNYFSSGATDGVELLNSSIALSTSTTKGRVIQVINGQTYFTSNDNPTYDGLNKLGTGIPTTSGQTATRISPASTSPFGFAISPDGNTLYMADDGTGITKYTKSGAVFVSAYLVNSTPARGLAVDFSGTTPVLYATTTAANANTIIKMTDAGGAATAATIATAPANTVYQGITFPPSCLATISTVSTTVCSGGGTMVIIHGNPTASVSYNINGGSTLTTTIRNNGYDTLLTGTLTGTTTYNLLSITTSICSSVALTGNVTIAVNPTPAVISGSNNVCNGSTISLSDISSGGTWSCTNTNVATVNSSGLVSGFAVGTAGISYTFSTGCTATTTVTVNTSPSAITGASAICMGATAPFSDITTGGTWSSTNTSAATISSVPVVVSGVSSGISVISYTLPFGCAATATVNVNTAPSAITGSTTTVCARTSIVLSDAVSGGVWSSSNTSFGTVDATGLVTGVSAGAVVITYAIGSCSESATVTVGAAPSAITGSSAICIGMAMPFSDITTGGTWSSTNTSVATISSTPVSVFGITSGTSVISYTLSSGCAATATVNVNTAPSAITGITSGVCTATVMTLSDAITGGVWSSNNTAFATVDATGAITGVSAGNAVIVYAIGSCSESATVTVSTAPSAITGSSAVCIGTAMPFSNAIPGGTWSSTNTFVATISSVPVMVFGVSPGASVISYTLLSGCTATATVNVNTSPAPITGGSGICAGTNTTLNETVTGGVWSSSNTSFATVDASGSVSGISGGTVVITYTIGSCSENATVTVTSNPSAITGPAIVCGGGSITLSDLTGGGVWWSSNTTVATVSATGIVYGLSAGIADISYAIGVCMTGTAVTVDVLPAITGPSSVCAGGTITVADAMPSGVWSSSNPGIATVDAAGHVSGITIGSSTIVYTVNSTCGTASVTAVITVNSFSGAGSISGTLNVCNGSTTQLVDPVIGGVWGTTAITTATIDVTGLVTGISAGVAGITYLVNNSCGYAWTAVLVTVNPLPSPVIVAVGPLLHTAATYDTYQWLLGGAPIAGATNATYIARANGAYSVTVTDNSGCMGTSAGHVVADAGVNNIQAGSNDLKLYPNPNQGIFTMELLSSYKDPVYVIITNVVGEKVSQFTTETNSAYNLQLHKTPGMYILSATTEHDTYVVKFVVE